MSPTSLSSNNTSTDQLHITIDLVCSCVCVPIHMQILFTGARVQAIISDRWYFGTAIALNKVGALNTNQQFANSHWLSVNITWDNENDEDPISPWDVQPYNEHCKRLLFSRHSVFAVFPTHGTRNAKPAVRDATEEELENFARYTAEEGNGLS
jgi:hypothetical protein